MKNTFELPDYNICWLDELNTGIFHEKTSEMYQCGNNNRIVFLPFIAFIDTILVAKIVQNQ